MNSPHPRNVFVKVKVPFDKLTAFRGLHERLFSGTPLQENLCGYSREGEKHAFILSLTLTGDASTALTTIYRLVTRMTDYHASFSEQPSEAQQARALEFNSSLRTAPAVASRSRVPAHT